jgi:hypothetical protein
MAQEKVGQFEFISFNKTVRRKHPDNGKEALFRVIVYGAYNAFGLIGTEHNGVAILAEEPVKTVLIQELRGTGTCSFGPTKEQNELAEQLVTCSDQEFLELIGTEAKKRPATAF